MKTLPSSLKRQFYILTALGLTSSHAQLINLDWGKGPSGFGTGASTLYSGAGATGSSGDFWNSADSESNTFTDLENVSDSAGNSTSFDVTWTDELESAVNDGAIEFGSTGHNELMQDYAFTSPGQTATITISALPLNADYTLYLYGVPDSATQQTTFEVTGANEAAQDVAEGNINDDDGLATPDDYVIFTGNTGAGGRIIYTQTGTGSGSGFSGSNGFQLDVGTSGGIPDPPEVPTLATPEDAATDAPIDTTILSWNAATDAADYNVFFWKSSDPEPDPANDTPSATTNTLSFDPGILEFGTAYSWLVQATNVSGTAESPTWSFTTQETPPPVAGTLINIDWGKNGSPGSILHAGAAAVGLPGDRWNTADAEENIFTDLENILTSTGAPTTVDVTWSDELQSSANAAAIEFGSSGHNALMEDYAFTAPGQTATVTISELPENTDYTLYLYGVPDSAGQDTTFEVTAANELAQTVTAGNINDDNGLETPEDYVIFTGSTGSSGQIVYTQTGITFSGSNGLQLLLPDTTAPVVITNIVRNSDDTVTLTWPSSGSSNYAVFISEDLTPGSWSEENESVPNGGETTIYTTEAYTQEKLFFRIEKK